MRFEMGRSDHLTSGGCSLPIDGWVDQVTGDSRYQVTFAAGGGACCFDSIAETHATYPMLNLVDPVYDGSVSSTGDGRYSVTFYNGGGACCFASVDESLEAYPSMLLHVP